MSKQIEALKQALKALELSNTNHWWGSSSIEKAITAIREALAEQPAQQQEIDELTAQRDKLADILTRTANALKGQPPELVSHSWHDLPEVAQQLKSAQQQKPVGRFTGSFRAGDGRMYFEVACHSDQPLPALMSDIYTSPQPAQQQEPVTLDPKDVHVEVVTKHMGGFAPVMTNGIRLTHKPTGIVVEETAERSAHRNRDVAWKKLAKLVASPPAQQQEHVSVMTVLHLKDRTEIGYGPASAGYDLPTGEYKLYTSPPASKPWVGLTDKEKKEIYRLSVYIEGAISLTEAKLREKNA